MRWAFWNLRGLNKAFKQRELGFLLRTNKINFAGLIEPRIKKEKATGSLKQFAKGWEMAHNYDHSPRGRIWINWKAHEVDIQIIECHEQLIHCKITFRDNNFESFVTIVYGKNTIAERKHLWSTLHVISNNINGPWCLCGDFNTVLQVGDRIQGQPISDAETSDLQNTMFDLNLSKMKAQGHFFTWDNGHVWSRIDKALCNPSWVMSYGHIVAEFKEKGYF